jgi:hypothetical protein
MPPEEGEVRAVGTESFLGRPDGFDRGHLEGEVVQTGERAVVGSPGLLPEREDERAVLAEEGVPALALLALFALADHLEAEHVRVEGQRAVDVRDVQAYVAGAKGAGHGAPPSMG